MAAPAFEHPAFASHATPPRSPFTLGLLAAANALATWEMRARTRAALKAMPPERLPDIGVTTAEALREAAKPFWRA